MITGATIIVLALLVAGFIAHLTIQDFFGTVVAPVAPILIWAVREVLRQRDTADQLEYIQIAAETLWREAKAGQCDEDHCLRKAREFQNAIYIRRASSPLIFPWVYDCLRPRLEVQMAKGADDWLAELSP